MTYDKVSELVRAERRFQDQKFGWPQDITLAEYATILGEEFGEFCQEVLRVRFDGKDHADLVKEIVQVAAVAFAIVESLYEEQLIEL